MIIPAVYGHCGFGLLVTALAIPLALRRVPMNALYGVRFPESFASDDAWYDINAYGGRILLTFGVALTLVGYLIRDLAPPLRSPLYGLFTVAPLVVMLSLLPMIVSYARRRVRGRR